MKTLLLILTLTFITSKTSAQTKQGIVTINSSINLTATIDSIDSVEYYFSKPLGTQILQPYKDWGLKWDSVNAAEKLKWKLDSIIMDSVVKSLKKSFPKAFEDLNSCIVFHGKDTSIKICNDTIIDDPVSDDPKSFTVFYFDKYEKGFLWIVQVGYEWRGFIIFNPETGILKSIGEDPLIIDDYIVCAAGNSYGDGGFEVMKLNDDSYFNFATYQKEILESFQIKNRFYFKIRDSFNSSSPSFYMIVKFPDLY